MAEIGGHRVELREVEEALSRHDRVEAAVAAAIGAGGRRPRLVAWVAAPANPEDSADSDTAKELERRRDEVELRDTLLAHLESTLPAHLVPSRLFVLAELPRTEAGDIDRDELEGSVTEVERGSPQAEIEHAVLAVVSEALGENRIGVLDHLFDLGVTSAMLTKVHQDLRATLDLDFPLVMLLEGPNIRQIARRLAGFRAGDSSGGDGGIKGAFDRGRKKRAAMLARSRRG